MYFVYATIWFFVLDEIALLHCFLYAEYHNNLELKKCYYFLFYRFLFDRQKRHHNKEHQTLFSLFVEYCNQNHKIGILHWNNFPFH